MFSLGVEWKFEGRDGRRCLDSWMSVLENTMATEEQVLDNQNLLHYIKDR